MNDSDKLCLKWNDFQENINSSFGKLRQDKEFVDVTLAADDGEVIDAHKVILVSSSPFFMNLLAKKKHPHPLIFMRGVKSHTLIAIVDFLYFGETNVFQEDLDAFLAVAEDLKLKGLTGTAESNDVEKVTETKGPNKVKHTERAKREAFHQNTTQSDLSTNIGLEDRKWYPADQSVALTDQTMSLGLQQLDEQINAMMESSENTVQIGERTVRAHTCKVCGKQGQSLDVKRHIEANHITGITHSCEICGKISRSKNELNQHRIRVHIA